ncbi:MAG: SirB2 family protein [Gammaproteobacteria bacterium]|nr:SirB2 family protein [Gammaproteobacteria bacterium]
MLYLIVKKIHILSALLSLALFVFRGGLMMKESPWLERPLLRIAPHVVDTVLLTTALWLMSLLHQYPFVHHWLTVKVVLLVVYIVLGSLALKRAKTKRMRIVFFGLAVATFLFIISVARTHNPLGVFSLLV